MRPNHRIRSRAAVVAAAALGLLLDATAIRAQGPLVPVGATCRYFKGRREPSIPSTLWRRVAFDDSSWLSGPTGIGYGDGDDATTLADMTNAYLSVYLRLRFDVPSPAAIAGLELNVDYDDGFVAYLNGVEVARRGLSGEPVPFSARADDHEASHQPASPIEAIPLCDAEELLVTGTNVLAIQVHNSALSSSDLTMIPELDAIPRDPPSDGPYLQLARPDSVLVRWHTNVPGGSTVEYGPYEVPASFPLSFSNAAPVTDHQVLLSGLSPGSHYSYRVGGDGEVRSDDLTFWTLVRPATRTFDFAVVGDSGTGEYQQIEIGKRIRERRPDFWLHAGDLVNPAGEAQDYDQQVLVPYKAAISGACLFPAMGDHDLLTRGGEAWKDVFSTFANNPGSSETWYSFDVGNAHFTVIDAAQDYHAGTPMGDWLRTDVAVPNRCWRFVVMHQPLYTSDPQSTLPEVQAMRADLAPIFEAAGVDVVFAGHVHAYERTFPLAAGAPVAQGTEPNYTDPPGPVYVVTGGGGLPLDPIPGDALTAHSESRFNFVWVQISDSVLTLEARDQAGTLFDMATITKSCALDSDGDGVLDATDNCPLVANPLQEDGDADGIGDACQDSDGDGVLDPADNCPSTSNAGQADLDGDRLGDACDPDADGDLVPAAADCDDLDAGARALPVEIPRVLVSFGATPGDLVLDWDDPSAAGPGTRSQVLSGTLANLWIDRGFTRAGCVSPGLPGTSATIRPGAGSLYFLMRAVNGCGHGTYGDASASPDPRDALDLPGDAPCP
jgi:predicted phosphodiesterase